jgi:hypothetical protein
LDQIAMKIGYGVIWFVTFAILAGLILVPTIRVGDWLKRRRVRS